MINLRIDICRQVREARRKAGLSQSELAAELGCNQSAISMFEQGGTTKLNDETVEKLAKKFGIDLQAAPVVSAATPVLSAPVMPRLHGFCPNPHCPTNQPYQVEDRSFFLPDREKADPVGGRFCAYCGEILEKRCPSCGAALNEGGVCSICGKPYIVTLSASS